MVTDSELWIPEKLQNVEIRLQNKYIVGGWGWESVYLEEFFLEITSLLPIWKREFAEETEVGVG